ncbi:MAG: PilZ domain-containing protein, partial [Methyloligellaceae bacterium]
MENKGNTGHKGQRQNHRFKLAMRAIVSDRQQQNAVSCIIHNGSISGCKIISRQVPALPINVLIKVTNLNQSIKGHIVWRNRDS